MGPDPNDVQRDWRRRGILPERKDSKRSSFSLTDVIRMTVLRSLSQSGIGLETADIAASLSVLPVISSLMLWKGAAAFEGDELSAAARLRILDGHVRGASDEDQFVVLPLGAADSAGVRVKDLRDAEGVMGRAGAFQALVVDHLSLAQHIIRTAPMPLVRFIVEVTENGES